MRLSVGILIGGASTRMGRAKAMLTVDGRTLLERTAQLALGVSDDVILLGSPPFSLPDALADMPQIPDRCVGCGPIGGLDALLAARPDSNCLLLACDMPWLTRSALERLRDVAGAADEVDAVAYLSIDLDRRERLHPCCAIYRPRAVRAVRDSIEAGRHGMCDLLSSVWTETIRVEQDEAAFLANWNSPTDVPPTSVVFESNS